MKLDLKDKKILFELCINSRQPSTQISSKVQLSREVVEYRIQRLIRKGAIKKFVTLINVEKLSYRPYNILILLHNFNAENEKEVISYLTNHPAVRWLVTCFGSWDIFFRINARDRDHFDALISEICAHFGDNLHSCEILTSVKKLKSVNPAELFLSVRPDLKSKLSTEPIFPLSKNDIYLLNGLSNNSRMSLIDLSKKIRLSPEAIRYRLKKLESAGIIEGYSCIIDLSVLNLSWYILLFSLRNIQKREENSLITLFKGNKKFWFADKNIGRWNLRLELLATDTQDFHKTLVELRNQLGINMNSFELLLINKEYLNERFPPMIAQNGCIPRP